MSTAAVKNWLATTGERLLASEAIGRGRFLARGMILLLALAAIKLALLGGLHEHVLSTHWRVLQQGPQWFDFANFYVFAAILVLTFSSLARASQSWSTPCIRTMNISLVTVGLLFAFLSRAQTGSNYLYPVMSGVLSLGDIRHYVTLDLFFAKPWLAAYLLVYPVIYLALVAARRESWSFHVLGGIAAFYLVTNLRDLASLGHELLLLNCVGVASLVTWKFGRGALHGKWQALPLLLVVGVWFFFGRGESMVAQPDAYFILLTAIALSLAAIGWTLLRHSAAYAPLSLLLPFYFLSFLLLASRHYPASGNYNNLVVYSLALPHYLADEILLCGLLLGGCAWLGRHAPRTSTMLFDATALALIGVALADLQMARNMGARLDWNALVVNNNPGLLWHTIKPFLGQLALMSATLAVAYFGLLRLAPRGCGIPAASLFSANAAPAWFFCTGAALVICASPLLVKRDKAERSGVVQIALTSPLLRGLTHEKLPAAEFARLSAELGLSALDARPHRPATGAGGKPLNVLLIVMESSYNRHLSLFGAPEETQPLLAGYRERMELFPNFYSVFPNSFHARFATFNGLFPTEEYVSHLNPRIEAPSLFEILHDHGYRTAVFDSCSRNYARIGDYLLHRKVDYFYDSSNMPGKERFKNVSWGVEETATMEAIKAQFSQHTKAGERFFVTYCPVAPHLPYDSPSKRFEKFDNGVGALNNDYTGRYKNQLLYMDWIITSLLDSLKELEVLDETLVIITNDHGEMVGDIGGRIGHGWSLEPWLCNTPLIIIDPRRPGYRVNTTLGSQVDVLPTALDLLGLPVPSGELYQGVAIHHEAANARKQIYLNSYNQRALVTQDRYVLENPEERRAGGPTAGLQVFSIRNEGVRTVYEPVSEAIDISGRMDAFERLQNSLIVHYSHYRKHVPAQGSPKQLSSIER